jgi:hypothetical protein
MRKCIHHLVSRLEILFKKIKNFGLDNEVEDLISKRSIFNDAFDTKRFRVIRRCPRFDY